MFQFRAFPSYGYFIHRTILEYCSSVLPHSEISGSTLICSSPKLIAACHVLHRLLMPRHSPCALISLTFAKRNCTPLRCVRLTANIHSVSFLLPFQIKPAFDLVIIENCPIIFGSLELCRLNRIVYKIVFTLIKKFHNKVF